MNESDKSAMTAALMMAVLPRELLGDIIINLAHVLTGAMVLEREAKGLDKLSPEGESTAISQFILLAAREAGVSAKMIEQIAQPASEKEPEPTPEQESAAKSEAEALLSRMRDKFKK